VFKGDFYSHSNSAKITGVFLVSSVGQALPAFCHSVLLGEGCRRVVVPFVSPVVLQYLIAVVSFCLLLRF